MEKCLDKIVEVVAKSRRNLDCNVVEERTSCRERNARNVQKCVDTQRQAKNQYTSVGITRGSFL